MDDEPLPLRDLRPHSQGIHNASAKMPEPEPEPVLEEVEGAEGEEATEGATEDAAPAGGE